MVDVFTKFKSTIGRQSGQNLKTPRTDGGEYVSNVFIVLCQKEWIVREVVPPYIEGE